VILAMGKADRSSNKTLDLTSCGVLVTCFRNCEAKCTRDAYFLLDKAAGRDVVETTEETAPITSFMDGVNKEVQELSKRDNKKFVAVKIPDVQCMIFLKFSPGLDPCKITETLFEMILKREISAIRFCQRMIPVQVLCKASMEEIKNHAERIIQPVFGGDPAVSHRYAVVFESRLNNSLDRMTVINMLVELVGSRHKVDLTNPEKAIVVQVFKSYVAMSVVSEYAKYRKYNLQEVLKKALPEK